MKILIVSQYFWPEKFRINDLVLNLKKKYDIDVLTGYPNYPEGEIYKSFKKNKKNFSSYKNIKIIRIPIITRKKSKFFLFLNYLSFSIFSSLYVIFFQKKKYDLIFTYQTSPVTAGICSIILKKLKNVKHVLWVQDLWPDTIYNMKIFKSKLILSLISKLSIYVYQNSDYIISQSEGIKKKLNKYLNNKVPIKVIRNWPEIDFYKSYIQKKLDYPKKNKNDFDIMFAGNIGEAQDVENIINCIKLTKKFDTNIRWIFLGKGSMFDYLNSQKKKFNLNNVYILGEKPQKLMNSYYKLSSALLITLKSGIAFDIVVPSKFVTYLKSSKPILGMINGETNKIIKKHKIGFCCRSGDYFKLFKNIKKLKKNYSTYEKEIFYKSKTLYKASFDRESQINKIKKILDDLK